MTSIILCHRLCFIAFVLICVSCGDELPDESASNYVSVEWGRLTLDSKPYGFSGTNAYYLQEEASRELAAGATVSEVVNEVFRELAELGVSTVRTNGFNDAPEKDSVIQIEQGIYSEAGFRGLDHVIAMAERYGLHLILSVSNYWTAYGGVDQYLAWNAYPHDKQDDRGAFFVEDSLRDHFKSYLRALMLRVNSETGRQYRDEPAVLAWELMNEPRGWGTSAQRLSDWYCEMAGELRALGAKQLIASGETGFGNFYGELEDSSQLLFLEQATASWLLDGSQATEFVLNSQCVDIASIHCYPEAWGASPYEAKRVCETWARLHHDLLAQSQIPLLMGEFGLLNPARDDRALFELSERRDIYSAWLSLAEKGIVDGAFPWMYSYDARPVEWDHYSFTWYDGSPVEAEQNEYIDLLRLHAEAIERRE
ncbi:MAG: cellulase family glycosylhydrolase [Myxococcales bacterium]|nr:MAG: cellulase family glycosylhydrolase [Myxococcales bacterium]